MTALTMTGGIRCRGMAVDVALGMDDIGDPGAGAADGELVAAGDMLAALEVLFQGLHLVLAVHHEFDVVPCGKPHIAVTVFVRDVTDLPDVFNGHEPASAAPDGKDLVTAFCNMHQNAGLQDLMICPICRSCSG